MNRIKVGHFFWGLFLLLLYIAAYFFIFDFRHSAYSGTSRTEMSVSRFAEQERVGDLSIYLAQVHWTNRLWLPLDKLVRKRAETR